MAPRVLASINWHISIVLENRWGVAAQTNPLPINEFCDTEIGFHHRFLSQVTQSNHLDNLDKATAQAESKRAWAEANRERIAEAFGVDPARAAALSIVPLVVLNHGFGLGLERHGVPVVDLHYLRVLLGSGSYQGDTRFERHVGVIYDPVVLYRSQAEFQARVGDLLHNPPPLKRFEGRTRWRRIPFETSDGTPFLIELPAMAEDAPPNALRDIPAYRPSQTRRGPGVR